MDCLEHYTFRAFREDLEFLKRDLLDPIKNQFGFKDDDEKNDEHAPDGIALDSEGRNIYEFFEDILGDCDVEKCAIFERYTRSLYKTTFREKINKYYALNAKEQNDRKQGRREVLYQQLFDAYHVCLFHTSARYHGIGLGNSEEHKRFLKFDRERYQRMIAPKQQQ